MAIELKMPALSPTMEEGTLAKWLVKEGDTVASGDILAEIETDKATMEFEAVDEGTITKILIAEGTDNVKVGAVIAMIAAEGRMPPRLRQRPLPLPNPPPSPQRPKRRARTPRSSPKRPSALRSAILPCLKAPRWSRPRCVKRCAMRWPRKCAATTACS